MLLGKGGLGTLEGVSGTTTKGKTPDVADCKVGVGGGKPIPVVDSGSGTGIEMLVVPVGVCCGLWWDSKTGLGEAMGLALSVRRG